MHNDNMKCILFVVLVHFNIILNVTYIYWTQEKMKGCEVWCCQWPLFRPLSSNPFVVKLLVNMCKSVQQTNTLAGAYTSPVTWLTSPPSTWKLFIWKSDENCFSEYYFFYAMTLCLYYLNQCCFYIADWFVVQIVDLCIDQDVFTWYISSPWNIQHCWYWSTFETE
jgi:hypothetical protein